MVARSAEKVFKLSPSSLNLYLECPRCFWLRFNKGITRPEGPSSTLPRGMDYTLKNYYDSYRGKGLPPELVGQVPGRLLQDQSRINEMRKHSFGFPLSSHIWFGGALDEALELEDGSVVPLDNKTKGFPPKEAHWTHLAQMSGYSLILREKGIQTKNVAYLVHWFFDHKNMKDSDPLDFNVAVEEVRTDPNQTHQLILEAIETLKGEIPPIGQRSGPDSDEPCSFCLYRQAALSLREKLD